MGLGNQPPTYLVQVRLVTFVISLCMEEQKTASIICREKERIACSWLSEAFKDTGSTLAYRVEIRIIVNNKFPHQTVTCMCESGKTSCYFGTNQVSLNLNRVWCLSFLGYHRPGGEIRRFPATKNERQSLLFTLAWRIIFKWNSCYPNAEIIWDKQTTCPEIYMKTNCVFFFSFFFFFFKTSKFRPFLENAYLAPIPSSHHLQTLQSAQSVKDQCNHCAQQIELKWLV